MFWFIIACNAPAVKAYNISGMVLQWEDDAIFGTWGVSSAAGIGYAAIVGN